MESSLFLRRGPLASLVLALLPSKEDLSGSVPGGCLTSSYCMGLDRWPLRMLKCNIESAIGVERLKKV